MVILNSSCNFNGNTGQNLSPQNPQWSKRCGLQLNSVTKFSSVRDSLTIKKSLLKYTFIKHKLCTSELAGVHQCSKVDFPSCCFVCLLYDLVSILFHRRLCIRNQHCLGWKIFCTYSRLPEASVSERQISRCFGTIRNSQLREVR